MLQEHQREQSVDFRLIGHQRNNDAAKADRLDRHVQAPAVALVVDQVDDRQNGLQPVGQQMIGWNTEGNRRRLDLCLRAGQAPLHRVGGHEESASDLLRTQSAQCPKRERHLRIRRQRGVTAGEDQLEPFVFDCCFGHLVLGCLGHRQQSGLPSKRLLPADPVDRAVPGGGDEPRARIRRYAVLRPAFSGDGESLLGGLLGERKVAEEADQVSQDPAPLLAEYLVEQD